MLRRSFIQAAIAFLAAPAALFRRAPALPDDIWADIPILGVDFGWSPEDRERRGGRITATECRETWDEMTTMRPAQHTAYISPKLYDDFERMLGHTPPSWIRRAARMPRGGITHS